MLLVGLAGLALLFAIDIGKKYEMFGLAAALVSIV
jgi:hypothetical protein